MPTVLSLSLNIGRVGGKQRVDVQPANGEEMGTVPIQAKSKTDDPGSACLFFFVLQSHMFNCTYIHIHTRTPLFKGQL